MSGVQTIKKCFFESESFAYEDGSFMVCTFLSWDMNNIPAGAPLWKDDTHWEFTCTGRSIPELSDVEMELTGTWINGKDGNPQFSIRSYDCILPSDNPAWMAVVMKNNGADGIGEDVAKMFGDDTLNVLMFEPERIREAFPEIPDDTLRHASETIRKHMGSMSTMSALKKMGIRSPSRIIAVLGDRADRILAENPYVLCSVPGYGFKAAEKLSGNIGYPADSDERYFAAFDSALTSASNAGGDMYFSKKRLIKDACRITGGTPETAEEKYTNAKHRKSLIAFSDEKILTVAANTAELEVSRRVCTLLRNRVHDGDLLRAFEEWKKKNNFTLTAAQDAAVRNVAAQRISVITGGAGTGKTTLVKALCESWKSAHPAAAITLLSPTGRAAGRMSEATGLTAATIHSTLGSDKGKLPDGLIVVDEASMVDAYVAQDLFNAVSDKSSVVICGDVNQLPSVGPGQVLAELIDAGVPTTRLSKVMRQGMDSPVLKNANIILSGEGRLEYSDDFHLLPAASENAQEMVIAEYMASLNEMDIKDISILTPLRSKGNASCNELNLRLQKEFSAQHGRPYYHNHRAFYVGDRVIQTKNNRYAANGDVGTIESLKFIRGQVVMEIAFDAGFEVTYEGDDLDIIDLAYAITIHKSQGSEYKKVIIPLLYDFKGPLYNRNLLYTAVTRAKENVVIIGDEKSVDYCINRTAGKRKSLLAARIKKTMGY